MEMVVPQKSRRVTLAEYFRLSAASETKLEFRAGEIIDMAGATFNHNRVCSNILIALGGRLRGSTCEAVGSDQRVSTTDDRYCYPDVTVVCGGPVFDPRDPKLTITNPQIVVEVLSESTEASDRGEKFFRYIRGASLREIVFAAQNRPWVQTFVRRDDGSWSVGSEFEGLDSSLKLISLDMQIPLREIYANVTFEAGSAPEVDQAIPVT